MKVSIVALLRFLYQESKKNAACLKYCNLAIKTPNLLNNAHFKAYEIT